MKKFLILSLGVVLSSFFFVSCNDSKSAIADLEQVVEKVDQLSADLTDEELDDIKSEYNEVVEKLQKYDYSDEELEEIAKLKGKYAAKMTKVAMKKFKNNMNDFGKKMKGSVEGFMDEMNKE